MNQKHIGEGDNIAGNKIIQINLPKIVTVGVLILMSIFATTLIFPLFSSKDSVPLKNQVESEDIYALSSQSNESKLISTKEETIKIEGEGLKHKEKISVNAKKEKVQEKINFQEPIDTIPTPKTKKEKLPAIVEESILPSFQMEEKDYFQARGSCIRNYQKYPNKTQAKLVAKKCAQIVAKSELAEFLLGLDFEEVFEVGANDMNKNEITSKLKGKIPRIYEAGKPIVTDEEVTVIVRIKKKDLLNYLKQ